MGGDHGPGVIVPAALGFLAKDPDCRLILVGREDAIREHLPRSGLPERLAVQHASQEVGMDELPSRALRGKKDSSMRVAIDLVKQGRIKFTKEVEKIAKKIAFNKRVFKN